MVFVGVSATLDRDVSLAPRFACGGDERQLVLAEDREPDRPPIRANLLHRIVAPDTAQAIDDVDDRADVADLRRALRGRQDEVIPPGPGQRNDADLVELRDPMAHTLLGLTLVGRFRMRHQ